MKGYAVDGAELPESGNVASTGGTVRLDRLDGAYWRDHYRGALGVLQ